VQIRSAIVLVIDGLGAGYLGPYGNTWIETPSLNRLAAESFLFEQALIDTPRLDRLYRSYWQGTHAMCPDAPSGSPPSLPSLFEEAGVATALLTDEPVLDGHPLSSGFSECKSLSVAEGVSIAEDLCQTHLARVFAAADDYLACTCRPFLLWIHTRGMYGPWDAPLALRNRFVDEDDPNPPDLAQGPCRMLDEDYDPDELLGIAQAYAGQVTLLDTCIGALLTGLAEDPQGSETALVLTGSRGFPLGEHRRVGAWDEALYSEATHVPYLVRLPDPHVAMARSQALVQPNDLYATLLDWFGLSTGPVFGAGSSLLPLMFGETQSIRDRAGVIAGSERSIRTPGWYLRCSAVDELFVKPDDRWDANEVSDRCDDVASQLREALDQFQQAAHLGDFSQLPPLPNVLVEGLQ